MNSPSFFSLRFLALVFLANLSSSIFDDGDSRPRRHERHHPYHFHQTDRDSSSSPFDASEAFLCKGCGRPIFRASSGFVHSSSPYSIAASPFTTIDANGDNVSVSSQRLINPDGRVFDLIAVKDAEVSLHGEAVEEHSWFHGYAWTVAGCAQCRRHLGWKFTAVDDAQCPVGRSSDRQSPPEEEEVAPLQFYGLIVSQLQREKFVSNLIKLPTIGNPRY